MLQTTKDEYIEMIKEIDAVLEEHKDTKSAPLELSERAKTNLKNLKKILEQKIKE